MNLLEKKFGRVRTANASVLWFHLTRVLPQSDFADGIMPLNLMLPGIWDMLAKMFAGTVHEMRLLQLRKQGVPGFLYDLKTGDSVHWGPFAMLIREASFRSSEMGNHDYLAMPEIVQDICRGYAEAFGVDLETEVSLRLRPCIVKFEAGPLERHHVEAAAYYLHIVEHGSEMSMWSNTCFSGEGRTIPPTHIERIDFI